MNVLKRQRPTPVSRARDSVVETIENARSRVDAKLDEAEREVERIAGRVDRRYRLHRDRARDAGRRLRDGYAAAQATLARLRRELIARLEAHPVGWPAAAGALGFLAGMAIGRRGRASAAR